MTYSEALIQRKKSLNDEISSYVNNNRPRLEIFRKISLKENLLIRDDNLKYNKFKSDEIKNKCALSVENDKIPTDILNTNVYENISTLNNNEKPENKEFIFEDINIEDNFKRLKSDLIPKEEIFEDYFQSEENFYIMKRNENKQRKHSY